MNDPKSRPSSTRPGTPVPAAKVSQHSTAAPAARPGAPAPASRTGGAGATGKVVHDDRGNAVWDWLAQTSRIAIDATSRLLKKLETPELKVEDAKDEELRIAPEPSTGSGYDPYNQATKPARGRK
jgi:hypothetical protein